MLPQVPAGSKFVGIPAGALLPYMRFAQTRIAHGGRLNLARSGMAGLEPFQSPIPQEGPTRTHIEAAAVFRQGVADRYGISPAGVQPGVGSSHANFVASLALARGGRLVAEEPAYEALPKLAAVLGASLRTYRRDPERDWRIDPLSLERAVDGGANLILLTDLHNPTGRRVEEDDYKLLADAAAASGAYVLVDEVYADFDPLARSSAVHRGPSFLATNSLTKVHGLGDWRAGWTLANPEVIERIVWHDDLVCPALAPHFLLLAASYMAVSRTRLPAIHAYAASRIARVDAAISSSRVLSWARPHGGVTGFVRVGADESSTAGDDVAAALWERHSVLVVPGSFFQRPAWVRISFGLQDADLDEALGRLEETARDMAR